MNDFQIFVWASDYEDFTGEGLLARLYIDNHFSLSNKKIQIYSNNGQYVFNNKKNVTIKRNLYVNNFIQKYLYSFYGIFLIWYHHIK
jgi:hypothetical protein